MANLLKINNAEQAIVNVTKGLSLCPFLQLPGSCFLLQCDHAGEFSACCFELRRSALLGNHTILEYNDFVGIFHRTHTVGNHDNLSLIHI